jgi:hypothetical protein
LNRHWRWLALTMVFSLVLVHHASGETAADTVHKWGLIGPWALDCSVPPARRSATLLVYEIVSNGNGRIVLRRDFGDSADHSEVVSAESSADGMLNLRLFVPSLKLTLESGLMMQPDGSMRAMYNRNLEGQYSIEDGKFTATGNPTPSLHKCN